MVKIVRHKALTVDGLRDRLRSVMAKAQRRECPTCHGAGAIDRPLTQDEVITGVGMSSSQYYAFTHKGKSLSLETGLRLLAWMDELERDKLDELDDEHEPRDPDDSDRESARLRQLRNVSSEAAAKAAIDARERPLQLIQPGGGRHG
jgi:hypothetical protein